MKYLPMFTFSVLPPVNPTYSVGATLVDWSFRALQRSKYRVRRGSKADSLSVYTSTERSCVVGSYLMTACFKTDQSSDSGNGTGLVANEVRFPPTSMPM